MPDKPKAEAHIFFPDTRFERMARRPGGLTREQAVAQAQMQVDNLGSEFTSWLDEQVQSLKFAAAAIDGTSRTIDRADKLSRALRDVGDTMGYPLVTFVSDALCNVFDAIRQGAPCEKKLIDCHIDALLLVKSDAFRDLRPEQVPELTEGLRQVGQRASNASQR